MAITIYKDDANTFSFLIYGREFDAVDELEFAIIYRHSRCFAKVHFLGGGGEERVKRKRGNFPDV